MRNFVPVLLLACSAGLAAKGGKPSTISVNVTVNQSQQYASPGTPTVIQSDGGAYINGQNGVCATIASTGVLTIQFDCSSVTTPRILTFVGFPAVPLAPTSSGTFGCSASESTFTPPYTNRLGAGPAPGGTPFQSMTIDPTGNTVYTAQVFIGTQFATSGGTNAYRLDYDYPDVLSDGALASPAQVRRLSATQWIVESAPSSALGGNPPNAAMLVEETTTRHSSVTNECAFYQVPFSFTLNAQ